MKQNIYDNNKFSYEYDKIRKENKGYNANDLIEIPNFRKLVPSVSGKKILDLGCGYGESDKYFKNLGASYVMGIDISKHMIDIANNDNKISGIDYEVMAMEDINQIDNKFDIVISSLAFHYVENFENLIIDIYNLLNDGGCLVFSQEHPLVTSSKVYPVDNKNHLEISDKWFLLVSDYNRCGLREREWNNQLVIKYHRNFSEIINTLIKVGFKIDKILEPVPNAEVVNKVPKYIHQYDRPYFLFVGVWK